jgi:hypothetical protein
MISGNLRKMRGTLDSNNVHYDLHMVVDGEDKYTHLNDLIGQKLKFKSLGIYHCVECAVETKKSYGQGYCFDHFSSLAECDMCIMKPETCHYDEGTCRDPRWAERRCMKDHYVYLANSSGIKVGITRHTQIPTRWIDQGAIEALPIIKVKTRYLSGVMEIELAKHISDKTNWRAMLKGEGENVDLKARSKELLKHVEPLIEKYGGEVLDESKVELHYPVTKYPEKITSLSFEKTPVIEDKLLGIKGQYLIFDSGVINLRKYNGLQLEVHL